MEDEEIREALMDAKEMMEVLLGKSRAHAIEAIMYLNCHIMMSAKYYDPELTKVFKEAFEEAINTPPKVDKDSPELPS